MNQIEEGRAKDRRPSKDFFPRPAGRGHLGGTCVAAIAQRAWVVCRRGAWGLRGGIGWGGVFHSVAAELTETDTRQPCNQADLADQATDNPREATRPVTRVRPNNLARLNSNPTALLNRGSRTALRSNLTVLLSNLTVLRSSSNLTALHHSNNLTELHNNLTARNPAVTVCLGKAYPECKVCPECRKACSRWARRAATRSVKRSLR